MLYEDQFLKIVSKEGKGEKKSFRMARAAAAMLFVVFICLGFFQFLISYKSGGETNAKEKVEAYFNDIRSKNEYIELYGYIQRLLGKRQIENFTIYKTNGGSLVQPRAELSDEEIQSKVDEASVIWQHLDEKDIPLLYIEPPLPIGDEDPIPYGARDYSDENSEKLNELISDISVLKVSDNIDTTDDEMFYRTDHHWSGDASFETYRAIARWLLTEKIIDDSHADDRFERTTTEGFLGSYGVKVGKYFAGTDDYVYYDPVFETDFTYYEMNPSGGLIDTKKGSWSEALMDQSVLEDPEYNNKYNAALWGNSGVNRIINTNDRSGKKALIIAHSYGRPLAAYLALDVEEVRYIDPQEGRFEGDYIQYIDEFDPDVVLFMGEFEGELIGEYVTGKEKAK